MRGLLASAVAFVPFCAPAWAEGARSFPVSDELPASAVPWVTPSPSPAPSGEPVPAPAPAPDLSPDLFRAVAAADAPLVGRLLDGGADANCTLPAPPPDDLVKRFRGTEIDYYFGVEKGLTPLMLASAMGCPDVVKVLLERGAKRGAVTKRHHTFALWLAGHYGHVEVMQLLLGVSPESEAGRSRIRISLDDQRAWYWKDGQIARTMPVSTGRKKLPTPKGRYVVTDKYLDWKSTLYPAKMPYFLRLSCKDFGMHAGVVPGYPASHGCIRLPAADAKALFTEVPVGTLVEIE